MKKVIAINKEGQPVLTTEATATKHGWWITYHLTVVLTTEKECDTANWEKEPKAGLLLPGLNGSIYKVGSVTPLHNCFECSRPGKNRIRHTFYCEKHFKELVVTKPIHRIGAATGRNDKCPCGSGKKYKHCCEAKNQHGARHYFLSDYMKMPVPVAVGK
jgi:hypothetical protein